MLTNLSTLALAVLIYLTGKAYGLENFEILSERSFKEVVIMMSDEPWLLVLHNASDSRFQVILPELSIAGVKLKGKVRMGTIDIRAYPELALEFDVSVHFPPAAVFLPAGVDKRNNGFSYTWLHWEITGDEIEHQVVYVFMERKWPRAKMRSVMEEEKGTRDSCDGRRARENPTPSQKDILEQNLSESCDSDELSMHIIWNPFDKDKEFERIRDEFMQNFYKK